MTIPITPGPFSFLAELGRAGGHGFAQAEQERNRNLDNAWKSADFLMKLAQIRKDPKILTSPEAMKVWADVGIPMPTGPTSDEMIEGIKKRGAAPTFGGTTLPSIPGIIPGQTQIEPTGDAVPLNQKILAGLPLPSQTLREQAAPTIVGGEVARAKAEVPKAELEAATATAALPEAGTTVRAGQQNAQDKQFNDIADAIVGELYSTARKMPTVQQALERAKTDRRANAFKGKIDQSYFGAALERLRAQLERERIGLIGASNRGYNSPEAMDIRWAGLYNQQIESIRKQQAGLAKEMGITPMDAAAHNQLLLAQGKGKQVSPYIVARATAYADYLQRKRELEVNLTGLQQQMVTSSGQGFGAVPQPGVPGQSGRMLDEAQVAERVQYAITNRLTEAQVREGVTRGHFSEADAQAIIAAMRVRKTHR